MKSSSNYRKISGKRGGSQIYHLCPTFDNEISQTVTVTMSQIGKSTPLIPTGELVYVVGGEVVWMRTTSQTTSIFI